MERRETHTVVKFTSCGFVRAQHVTVLCPSGSRSDSEKGTQTNSSDVNSLYIIVKSVTLNECKGDRDHDVMNALDKLPEFSG